MFLPSFLFCFVWSLPERNTNETRGKHRARHVFNAAETYRIGRAVGAGVNQHSAVINWATIFHETAAAERRFARQQLGAKTLGTNAGNGRRSVVA